MSITTCILTKFKLNILNIIIFSELAPVWKKRLIHSFIFKKFYNLFKNATMWLAKSIFGHILRTKISPKMQFLQNVNRPLLQFLIKIRANIFPLLRLIFNYNSPVNSWNTIRAGRGWWWWGFEFLEFLQKGKGRSDICHKKGGVHITGGWFKKQWRARVWRFHTNSFQYYLSLSVCCACALSISIICVSQEELSLIEYNKQIWLVQ